MKFVTVQVYNNYIEAHIILGRLMDENINCWLRDENTVTLNPILTNAVGGIKLMVAETQADQAITLLKQFRAEQREKTKCPKCQSDNIEFVTTPRKISNWLGVLVGLFFTDYALSNEKLYHCFNCGYEFEAPDDSTSS
jgi:DNA-directed RNA polymerase subunit M/transcription elongation factor TFIIS